MIKQGVGITDEDYGICKKKLNTAWHSLTRSNKTQPVCTTTTTPNTHSHIHHTGLCSGCGCWQFPERCCWQSLFSGSGEHNGVQCAQTHKICGVFQRWVEKQQETRCKYTMLRRNYAITVRVASYAGPFPHVYLVSLEFDLVIGDDYKPHYTVRSIST